MQKQGSVHCGQSLGSESTGVAVDNSVQPYPSDYNRVHCVGPATAVGPATPVIHSTSVQPAANSSVSTAE